MTTELTPLQREKTIRIRAFMDGVDWQHELGSALGGSVLYPDEDDCRERCAGHIDSCGMVEVEVRLIRWVLPQSFGGNIDPDTMPEPPVPEDGDEL